ncbi:MAG: hypothetical protein ABJB47_24520 [Actinomycetota bacterium]
MPHPVLLEIDDDAGVVQAIGDDLTRRFGEDYQVIAEPSAGTGLAMRGPARARLHRDRA